MRYWVYFLIKEGCIIYIGLTCDYLRRIKEHVSDGRIFDTFRAIEVRSQDDGKRHEKWLIRKFRPKLNKQCTTPIRHLNNDGIIIKVPGLLKEHVNQYVAQKKVKGGLSGMIKRYLIKKTGFEKK